MNEYTNSDSDRKSHITASEITDYLDKIPVLPAAINKAQTLLDQPVVDIDKLVIVLEGDPGLVSRVLRIANSSFYGMSREIKSVKAACIVLGQYTLRNIILTTAVMNATKNYKNNNLHKALLEHCIYTGLAARYLARLKGQDQDIAYMVGLLHDIGCLFIETINPHAVQNIRSKMKTADVDNETVEKEVLGFDHAEFSSELARHWNMPDNIVTCILNHHNLHINDASMSCLIQIADIVAKNINTEEGLVEELNNTGLMTSCHLSVETILQCRLELVQQIQRNAESLDLM